MATPRDFSRIGVFHDPDHLKRTFAALNDQRNIGQFCDIILKVCGTQISAHSGVLAAASPYFCTILGTGAEQPRGFSHKNPQIIEIHIDSREGDGGYGDAVSHVVEFMYTSQVSFDSGLVLQITEIGKIMQMESLLQYCEMFQKGESGNGPKTTSTCTSGLSEVAEILGSRSKIIKRKDVFTETEQCVFDKIGSCDFKLSSQIQSQESTILDLPDYTIPIVTTDLAVSNLETFMPIKIEENLPEIESLSCQIISDLQVMKVDPEVEDLDDDLSITTNVGFESIQDQNDASLLLAISNVRPPLHTDDRFKCQQASEIPQDTSLRMATPEPEENVIPALKQENSASCNESFSMQTVAEMMNEASHSETIGHCSTDIEVKTLHVTVTEQLNYPDIKPCAESEIEKSIDFDDISDLVQFHNMEKTSLPTKNQRGRPPGRPRGSGRGRGRKRGRGRGPGRPRKIKEEADSDPEFEDFIQKLERGDDVLLENSKQVQNKKDQTCFDKKNVKLPNLNTATNILISNPEKDANKTSDLDINNKAQVWKSKRIRSKPSQLKKDYVLHSLSKRKRVSIDNDEKDEISSPCEEITQNPIQEVEQHNFKSTLQFLCEKCNYSSASFKEYRQHLKVHPETDPKYFVCSKCDFKTLRAKKFRLHRNEHLSKEFICSYCEHQSEDQQTFDEHATKHAGEFPFFCTECDSKFKTKNQLLAHKPKHQLMKPFGCPICHAGFKWKHALKNHMITHNPSKDHLCDVCGYTTAHKSQLKAHKLIHSGQLFKCPEPDCTFQAIKRQNLKYHMVTHTHERPHQCEICGQSFSLVKNMRRHMLLHSDTRRYNCKMCNFHTTRYDKLKEHLYKLHNIGEQPGAKKTQRLKQETADSLTLLPPNAQHLTLVSSEGIQINADGTISEETLQQIAQLASAQNSNMIDIQGTSINISERRPQGSGDFPIIATVQYTDGQEVQYIAEVAE